MVRIFVTGDNHVGLKYNNHEQRAVLVGERIEALARMVGMAEKEGCSLFVVTGDLFDSVSVAKRDVKAAAEALSAFSGTVAVLPGNHDFYDEDAAIWRHWRDVTETFGNLLLLSECHPYIVDEGEERIALYPALCTKKHSAAGENNLGWIKDAPLEDGVYRLGVAHGAIEGLTIDNEGQYFLMKRDELEAIPVDAWLIGHTHVPFPRDLTEEFTACGRIFNAGTHVQTDVSCNTEGQCFIVEIGDDKTVRAKKVVPSTLRFHRREVAVTAGEMANDLRRAVAEFGDNSVVDLILRGAVTAEEYAAYHTVVDEATARFLEVNVKAEGLTKLITEELIDTQFPETSFSAGLLKALLDDPQEAHLMYELLTTLKEGH